LPKASPKTGEGLRQALRVSGRAFPAEEGISMQLSAEGLDLIKRFEGFRNQQYTDVAGFPTIGYGHRIVPPEAFPNGMSEPQAANLLAGDVSAARFGPYAERMCREIESMRKLVYVFYHQSFSFGKLIRANPDIRGDLTDCLIGNLDKDFQQLFQAVEEQAAIPAPLPHGRPLVTAAS